MYRSKRLQELFEVSRGLGTVINRVNTDLECLVSNDNITTEDLTDYLNFLETECNELADEAFRFPARNLQEVKLKFGIWWLNAHSNPVEMTANEKLLVSAMEDVLKLSRSDDFLAEFDIVEPQLEIAKKQGRPEDRPCEG